MRYSATLFGLNCTSAAEQLAVRGYLNARVLHYKVVLEADDGPEEFDGYPPGMWLSWLMNLVFLAVIVSWACTRKRH